MLFSSADETKSRGITPVSDHVHTSYTPSSNSADEAKHDDESAIVVDNFGAVGKLSISASQPHSNRQKTIMYMFNS